MSWKNLVWEIDFCFLFYEENAASCGWRFSLLRNIFAVCVGGPLIPRSFPFIFLPPQVVSPLPPEKKFCLCQSPALNLFLLPPFYAVLLLFTFVLTFCTAFSRVFLLVEWHQNRFIKREGRESSRLLNPLLFFIQSPPSGHNFEAWQFQRGKKRAVLVVGYI